MNDSYQPQPPTPLVKISPRICRGQRTTSDDLPFSTPIHRGWKWKAIRLFGLMFFLLGNVVVHAQTSMSEYQVKALFLCNFVKYVTWPAEAMPGATSPIVIGILGQDNFDDSLTHAVEGKNINGREIVIKHFSAGDDLSGCAILFVSSSENSRLGQILTVGESDSFLQSGGIINFMLKEGKIHLAINVASAQKAKLEISSKLLSVADVVKE